MDEEDIKRIQENLRRLIAADKPESVIQSYLRDEGFDSAEAWRSAQAAGHAVPRGSLLSGAARAPSDRSRAASNRASNEPITVREATRLAAAGVIPGWSDEVIGRVRSISPNQTYREAVADEREALASGRSKAGSGLLEFGSGMATGFGATSLAARATGMGGRVARGVLGMPTGAPQTVAGAAGTGARIGATAGAAAGSGSRDDGSLGDRMTGGVVGAGVGGLLGALMGGTTTAAMNRVRPDLDAADLRTAFGADTPEARRAVRETAESFRLGEIDARDVQAAIRRGDVPAEYPLNVADLGGPGARTQLARADISAQGGRASGMAEEVLTTRAAQTPRREAENLTRATGRQVGASKTRIEEITAQKSRVDDLMFSRARAAARARGPIRASLDLKQSLMLPDVQQAVEDTRRGMTALGTGRRATDADFVDPYLRKKGKIVGVKPDLDPVTLDHVGRRLGERSDELAGRTGSAADRTLGAGLSGVRQQIRDVLGTIPEFAEANALSARMNDYRRALDAGRKANPLDGPEAIDALSREWRAQAPVTVPADVADEVARITGLSPGALPGAWDEFTRGAQIRQRTQTLRRKGTTPAPPAVEDVESLVYGPEAASTLAAGRRAETEMSKTAKASPSVRGRFQTIGGSRPEDAAMRSTIRDAFIGINSPRFGMSLVAGDIARLGAARMMRPTQAQLTGEMTGLLGTYRNRDALLNLIGQTQDQLDTPIRRGLFGALTYGAGGYPDSPR